MAKQSIQSFKEQQLEILIDLLKEAPQEESFLGNESEAINISDFLNTPIDKKVKLIQNVIDELDNKVQIEALKKAAYYALTDEILDHNLSNENQLPFIYDLEHAHKITELKETIEYLHSQDDQTIQKTQTRLSYLRSELSSSFNGIKSELSNCRKDIGKEFGEFIKNPFEYPILKKIDERIGESLDRGRLYLKSDPSQRNMHNRMKQVAGGLFNFTAWSAKQCVNAIRKPIAFTANMIAVSSNIIAWPYYAMSGRRKQCEARLINSLKHAATDLRQSIVAGVVVFTAIASSPFVGPAAGILTGVGLVGGAAAITAAAHVSALTMTTPGIAAQVGENVAKGAYLAMEYTRTGNYTEPQKKALEKLYHLATNSDDLNKRKEALEIMNKFEEHLKTEQLKQDKTGRILHNINKRAFEMVSGEKTSPKLTQSTNKKRDRIK